MQTIAYTDKFLQFVRMLSFSCSTSLASTLNMSSLEAAKQKDAEETVEANEGAEGGMNKDSNAQQEQDLRSCHMVFLIMADIMISILKIFNNV